MPAPLVKLVATGGTIAMTGSPARPALSADELIAAAPGIEQVAHLEVEQLSNVPGVNLAPEAAARAIAAAAEAVTAGADGAVITQGTDTIEETAELADLVWGQDAPLAITGAIRTGGATSADGPLNLLDAVRVASARRARGAGAVVVFDGMVHPAGEVVKSHSWRSDAFASDGPLGYVSEGELRLLRPPARDGRPIARPAELAAVPLDAYVPIVAAAAGLDSRPLDAVRDQGAAAIVLMALGAGHVPEPMLPGIDAALAAGVPVIACARPARGGTLTRTYGFKGSETDLAERGVILAGDASPWKARIRALVALALARPAAELFERPTPAE
jgi:L-asparaginase